MKYKLVKASELKKLLATAEEVKQDAIDEAYNKGYEEAEREQEYAVEELQIKTNEQSTKIKKQAREIAAKDVEIEVLTKQKSDARDVVTKRLANENIAADLKAREELVAKRETKVQTREDAVSNSEVSEEDKQYKSGYADGIADGVRKIGEITQVDRQNAMDVAMVSAASHTQPETVKAVLDGSKAIKSSLANKEDK